MGEKVDLCPEGGVALLRALFDHMAAQCSEGAASTASLLVPPKSGGQGTVNPPVRTGLVSQTCLQYDGCPENARPVHVRKAPRTYPLGSSPWLSELLSSSVLSDNLHVPTL